MATVICACDGDLCIRTHAGLCHGLMTESCRVHQIRFREGGHGICSREHVWRAGGVPSRGLAREAKIRSHSGRAAKAPTMPPLSCGSGGGFQSLVPGLGTLLLKLLQFRFGLSRSAGEAHGRLRRASKSPRPSRALAWAKAWWMVGSSEANSAGRSWKPCEKRLFSTARMRSRRQ